jgi:inorganic pyrophosphatase
MYQIFKQHKLHNRCRHFYNRCLQYSSASLEQALQPKDIDTVQSGETGTTNFSLNFRNKNNGKYISPWHDVNLVSDMVDDTNTKYFNFINEIPRYTKPKMEIATGVELNPIVQDVKKGKLRDYHGPLYWNYGCLPQTWEDPDIANPDVENYMGDNDPLDVVEIGSEILEMGAIVPVKPLGIFSMIDSGELDWKLIAIRANDPMAKKLNNVDDVEKHCPGTISGIREWFRWYKTPDGKKINAFGHGEVAMDREYAVEIIDETHTFWKDLVEKKDGRHKLWVK